MRSIVDFAAKHARKASRSDHTLSGILGTFEAWGLRMIGCRDLDFTLFCQPGRELRSVFAFLARKAQLALDLWKKVNAGV